MWETWLQGDLLTADSLLTFGSLLTFPVDRGIDQAWWDPPPPPVPTTTPPTLPPTRMPQPCSARPVGCHNYAWPVSCSDAPQVSGRP
jgi:hypothetical protein